MAEKSGPGRPGKDRPASTRNDHSEDDREMVRVLVARMHRRGHTVAEIADQVGRSLRRHAPGYGESGVRKVLRELRENLTAVRPERTYAAMVEEKVEELREVRKEAWAAGEASKGDVVRVVNEDVKPRADPTPRGRRGNDPDGAAAVRAELVRVRRTTTTEGRLPDSAYLAVVLKTLDAEMKLLGLDAGAEAAAAGLPGGGHWTKFLVGPPLPAVGGDPLELGPAEFVPPDGGD